jgi:BMFP domain-containing protein YqiC
VTAKAALEMNEMSNRPQLLDDLAGVAGGAVSALAGLRDEARAIGRARAEAMARRFDLVRREEFDAMAELAANARADAETALTRIAALEARIAALEAPKGPSDGPEIAV